MVIKYYDKEVVVSGELTFTPPVFYVDTNSLIKWEKPNDNKLITNKEKEEIIEHLTKEGDKVDQTKIIFD